MAENIVDVWLPREVKKFLEDGHVKIDGSDKYYFLPFVFKESEEGHMSIVHIQKTFPDDFKI